MPLQVIPNGCTAIVRANEVAQWDGNCPQPIVARWPFADSTASLLLCHEHAEELAGEDRLSDVVHFYDAPVEDVAPA